MRVRVHMPRPMPRHMHMHICPRPAGREQCCAAASRRVRPGERSTAALSASDELSPASAPAEPGDHAVYRTAYLAADEALSRRARASPSGVELAAPDAASARDRPESERRA